MSRKKKILLAAAGILFLLLLLLLIWFLNQKTPAASVVVVPEIEKPVVTPRVETEVTEAEVETEQVNTALQSLAITFAERYGSYSTQSSFANLYDVMDLMTATLRTQTENFIATAQTSPDYYGVTTRVLSVKIISSDATSASLEAATQREESNGGPQNSEIKYQKLLLTCLKENGVWKVASALWQ
ncbi:MAG: hypothetical protein WC702_04470 [Patescibacteria group bacterium]|jgi:hypothetical protein